MDLSLPFLAGLLGSLHCVGMCGAIVLAYSTRQSARTEQDAVTGFGSAALTGLPAHVVYNAGRVFSYALCGALAGYLGGTIGLIRDAGIWLSIVGGATMVVAGILMLGLFPRLNVWSPGEQTGLRKIYLKSLMGLLSLRSLESAFYIGLLTPFLPCGLLYSMFIKAASSGSAIDGALTMLLFGLGIVPALLVTGVVSAYVGTTLRHYANRLAAVTIILMGAILIIRGAGVTLPFISGAHHGLPQFEQQQPLHSH